MTMVSVIPELDTLRTDFDVRRAQPGRYTVAFTLGAEGGAVAVVQREGLDGADHQLLVHLRSFGAEDDRSAVVRHVIAAATPHGEAGETTLLIDETHVGNVLRGELAKGLSDRIRAWYSLTTSDTPDATSKPGDLIVPVVALCAAALRTIEAGRWHVHRQVTQRNDATRLEQEARRGELSPSSLAIALALWHASCRNMHGQWSGRAPKPRAADDHVALEIAAARERAEREASARYEANKHHHDERRDSEPWEPFQ
jgi:hypothetical protein